tara:strand:+ start:322 stop:735 length:414 start_codon:yes stop_codon:yes gene_type:complete
MAAGNYSFTIEQGATTDFEIVYKDSAGNPIDLSGYQARMHLRKSADEATTYLVLSSSLQADGTGLNLSGSGGLTATKPPTSGSIGIYVSHATSSNLSFTDAVYDLEIVSSSGDSATVTRLIQGKIKLSKEVTKGSSY